MSNFDTLKPSEIWHYFDQILQIPRPSKHEEKIRNFLIDFALEHNLPYKTDSAGNLLISKAASPGFENRKTVILQSHMDMVGEKNSDSDHNFFEDEIRAKTDGEWVKAENTTLGADDGIGIAAQLAILASETIEHGPLECLFTVDEETGLTGAKALEEGFFTGKTLLNLDSEDEGELFIGCAGGIDTIASFTFRRKKIPEYHIAREIIVTGLTGGHSGDEIHKGLGNSNKIINRFLWNAGRKFLIRLAHFDGGNLRNAIPREAKAIFTVPDYYLEELNDYFQSFSKQVKNELRSTEKNLTIKLKESKKPDYAINRKTQGRLLNALYACPHGVYEWSREIAGMVETSTNLASVKFMKDDQIVITTSQRSSVESAKADIASKVRAVFEMAKADVIHTDGYPGWQPDPDSEIVRLTVDSYKRLFSEEPVVRAIHAGLECGLFLEKYPDLDMISFGPTIKGAHSPDERLHIESTQKFWDLLLDILKRIQKKN